MLKEDKDTHYEPARPADDPHRILRIVSLTRQDCRKCKAVTLSIDTEAGRIVLDRSEMEWLAACLKTAMDSHAPSAE